MMYDVVPLVLIKHCVKAMRAVHWLSIKKQIHQKYVYLQMFTTQLQHQE